MTEYRPESHELAALSTRALVEYIVSTHHDYIWARLPFLVPMAAKIARRCCGSGPDCVRLAELVRELRGVLLDHLDHEERTLATLVDYSDGDMIRSRIAEMHHEHVAVQLLLERVLEALGLPRVPAPDACPTERALLHELANIDEHVRAQIRIEDDILAPRFADAGAP